MIVYKIVFGWFFTKKRMHDYHGGKCGVLGFS